MSDLIVALTLSSGISFLLTPVLRRFGGRLGLMDLPNERSSHQRATPRSGGVAVVAGILVAALASGVLRDLQAATVLGAGLLMAILGIADDVLSLPPWPKMLIQVSVAAMVVLASSEVFAVLDFPPLGKLSLPLPAGIIVTVFWAVGVTNEFNFMDGINGILSMESVLAAAAYSALFLGLNDPTGAAFSLAILGGTAGFMPWNFHSGSIFMGDGGSATLGFLFAFLVVRLVGGGASIIAALLPLFPFLFDSSLTILLRMGRGERFFATPHRSHLYQRLIALGWSHVAVTSLWGLLAALCCAIALRYDNLTTPWQFAALSAVVGIHGTLACAVLWAHSRRTAAPARAENPGG